MIQARRNHTATMIGSKAMVVIGGLSSDGVALNDIFVLDMATFRWASVGSVNNKYVHAFTNGIAHHAASFVSEDEHGMSFNVIG